MKHIAWLLIPVMIWVSRPVLAQMAAQPNNPNVVVTSCGTAPTGYPPSGRRAPDTVDVNGNKCTLPFSITCPPGYTQVEGVVTTTSATSSTIIAAPGAGLKTYIYSAQAANTGTTTSLVTFTQGDSTGKVLGYTINPSAAGSNIAYVGVLQTTGNFNFDVVTGSGSTTQYISAQGCTGP
jgi:hypothetical protein